MGNRLATIYMGGKVGAALPLTVEGAGSPSNTMWPGPRPTPVPSGILLHPTVWPQQSWAENWGCVRSLFFWWGGSWDPSNTMWPGPRPTIVPSAPWFIDPFGHNRHGLKSGGLLCPLFERAGSPSNTMSPGPRPTSVPSGLLIHPAVWSIAGLLLRSCLGCSRPTTTRAAWLSPLRLQTGRSPGKLVC